MNMRSKPFIAFSLGVILLATAFVCGCTDSGPAPAETGTISVTGSTTVLPLAQLAAEAYMDAHREADIQVSGGGSSVGVKAVGEGTAEIGMASRELKSSESEAYPGLVRHVVAKDAIAIIVNPSNTVSDLSVAQIKSIYRGDVTNWKDVGGPDETIVVVGRDSASGTREYFLESVMDKEDFTTSQLEKNSNGAVRQTVAQTPGAIGYVGLGYLDGTVKAVPVNNGSATVDASVATVLSGEYPIARGLNMYTVGQPAGLAADYLAFIMSPDGQALVAEEGFVPIA
ncbi:phosphate ABC transporter substrate-binding protein PstS family protein [Methanogenium sp. S4BF]|uniref:phosphate ABC transporter substrate-binding protein n=1 Tax=Methanogenium sp. S4BF TaxID=1789226 RepID=UPI002417080E|nr:phosphate ABC transporter substrate-binding protein PstS family protein [Methanogenium sp. S4BF]WFN34245.1 phosphate ABC transporter substrate-binding protein PstS family protein [Methanogenium sp. S4BF]